MNTSNNDDLGASYLSHQLRDNSHSIFNPGDDGSEDSRDGDDEKPTGVLREQDRFLPIANVARIMKRSIPKTGKIAKEARDCVQECVSEFVSFITSEASDRCHQEKRKTINGEDILYAMSSLGFDSYVEPLKVYLQKYRELNKTDKGIIALSGEGGSPSSTSAVASSSTASSAIGRDPLETTPVTQISSSQGQSSNTVVFAYDLGGN